MSLGRIVSRTDGCPAGCWITRGSDGNLYCDCSGALKMKSFSLLRGADGSTSPIWFVIPALIAGFFVGRHY